MRSSGWSLGAIGAAVAVLQGCYELPVIDPGPIVDVPPPGPVSCAPEQSALIACTLDGDTFDLLQCGNGAERVRLLGVDAPEIAHPGSPADCFGDASAEAMSRLVTGRTVILSFDQDCTDIYGRTLAYVWLEPTPDLPGAERMAPWVGANGLLLVNEWLLAEGLARVYPAEVFGPVRLQERLQAAEDEAKTLGLGLWGACGASGG